MKKSTARKPKLEVIPPAPNDSFTSGIVSLLRPRIVRELHKLASDALQMAETIAQGGNPSDASSDVLMGNVPAARGLLSTPDKSTSVYSSKLNKRVHVRGEHHGSAKLTEKQVLDIRRRAARGEKYESIAADHGTTRGYISTVASGRTWQHVGGPITHRPHKRR